MGRLYETFPMEDTEMKDVEQIHEAKDLCRRLSALTNLTLPASLTRDRDTSLSQVLFSRIES